MPITDYNNYYLEKYGYITSSFYTKTPYVDISKLSNIEIDILISSALRENLYNKPIYN